MSADQVGAPGLPSGVVSLLFSDVEGSTRLVRELGDAWGGVLDRQRELCRAAWAAHDGVELGTEGDSFFVVFADAGQAVAAAVAAQRALGAEPWPAGALVRVRIGIHSGSPARQGEGYVGMDVHRAARIAACAHGGQIVISAATAELVGLPDLRADAGQVVAVDLGEHQLKDVPGRTRLFQVNAPGLDREFATIRSLGAAGSLPDVLTPVIGRDGEIAEVADLIGAGERLVTLTGPGGTGKTRLSVAVAAAVAGRFVDGVFFVPLAAARSATDTWTSIARVLEVPADGQIPPGFFDHVAHRRMLLVLDNLEQIDGADEVVRALLAEARHVQILTTSRRPLHVAGEREIAVAPLPLPVDDGLVACRESAAVAMFLDHAGRVRPGFALSEANAGDLAELCAALDGLPLAIELAAARVKLLSPAAILARLDKALDLASVDRGRDSRQRTIHEAIAWSYDLLEPTHRTVFDHLGVFAGGATPEALTAVLPPATLDEVDLDDVLYDLLDASLITVTDTPDGGIRVAMLVMIARYAADRLRASGAWDAAALAHSQYFYEFARHLLLDVGVSFRRELTLAELANLQVMADRGCEGISHRHDEQRFPHGEVWPEPVPRGRVPLLLAFVGHELDLTSETAAWLEQVDVAADDPNGLAGVAHLRGTRAMQAGDLPGARHLLDEAIVHLDAATGAALPDLTGMDMRKNALINLAYLHYVRRDRPGLEEAARLLAATDPYFDFENPGGPLAHECRFFAAMIDGDWQAARDHLVGHLSFVSEDQSLRRLNARLRMGDTFLAADDLVAAHAEWVRFLEPFVREGTPGILVEYFCALAAAVSRSHPLHTARAHGCAETFRVAQGLSYPWEDRRRDDQHCARARLLVTEQEWNEAFAAGREDDLYAMCRELAALDPSGGS